MRPSGNHYENLAAQLAKILEEKSYNAPENVFALLKNYCSEANFETQQFAEILKHPAGILNGLRLKQLVKLALYFGAYCPIEWNKFIESIEDQAKQTALKKENELRNAFQDLAYLASVPDSDTEKYNENRTQHNDTFKKYKTVYTELTRDPYPEEHGAETHLFAIQTRYRPKDQEKLNWTEISLNTPLSPHLNPIDEEVVKVRCKAVEKFIKKGYIRIKADRPLNPYLKLKPSTRRSLFPSLSETALAKGRLSSSSPNVFGPPQYESLSTGTPSLTRSDSLQEKGFKKLNLKKLDRSILNSPDPEPTPMPDPSLT